MSFLMSLLRRRSVLITLVAVLALSGWLLVRDTGAEDASIIAPVKRGDFRVTVTTSGELSAEESVNVTAPANAQQIQVYQLTIQSIVPEGTEVQAGDVVAQLDRSQVAAKLSEVTLALQKATAVYEQAMLDSTLTLSQAREDIIGLELALEERRLAEEQAVYEAPTVRRQAEIDLERADRQLNQAREAYKTRVEQAEAKMREVGADMERERNRLAIVQQVMEGFTVRAPAPGMVIYVKEWNGRKKTVGSRVSPWDPAVATLPDLTKMESITYVNEIDIRKIAEGQPVTISLDSDPDKRLEGTVTAVANVGEQRPNTDAKVFEIQIKVEGSDTTLRPGMTTGNAIETQVHEDVLFVPIEALGSENGIPFVYHRDGGRVRKREVVTGAMNENEVVIVRGLEENDAVLLAPPPNGAEMTLERLPDSPVPESGAEPVVRADTSDRSGLPPQDTVPLDTIELDTTAPGR
ncbi:MAG: efflux RND transporter periplasmic adaptor subunit [Gemmatimonadota bacterium]|nr:efflux RND transporter periplasmic adaptor subunit [Gemmatimonadota bacterium]